MHNIPRDSMNKSEKVTRTKEEMLGRLATHLKLLRKYIIEFEKCHDHDLIGEIAGKLRLLVWKSRSNKPLLIRLAREYNIELIKEFDRPGGFVRESIEEYLSKNVYSTIVEDTQYTFSVMDLIILWSCQSGAAHEDWNIEKKFDVLLKSTEMNMTLNGYQATLHMFISHAKSILNYGISFMNSLNSEEKSA